MLYHPGTKCALSQIFSGARMSEWFFRSSRPGYPHPVCSELENSGIRLMIAVSLNVCSGIQLIKLAKLYTCTQTHYKHAKDGCMVLGVTVCGHGSIPLSHSRNVLTRIGLHTNHKFSHGTTSFKLNGKNVDVVLEDSHETPSPISLER